MNETLNVKIGSVVFTIETEAYNELRAYYNDISARLYESERREIMEDVESRTADIFRESVDYPSQPIDIDIVKKAMDIIGSPHNFGQKLNYDTEEANATNEPPEKEKLYRSRNDRMVAGVCGGLADYFDMDSSLVRVLMVLSILFFSAGLWIYIVLWIIIPQAPLKSKFFNKNRHRNERR